MPRWGAPKTAPSFIWEEIRRAWEGGETAASLAKRYDVGLSNLWRRRAAEAWERRERPAPQPEPVEGWDRHGEARLADFLRERDETRILALTLLEMLRGARPAHAPTWHIGWLFVQRATRLGPEVAAADRAWAEGREWAPCVWDETGAMRPMGEVDRRFLELWRDDWRAEAGLPEGAARRCPCPPPMTPEEMAAALAKYG